MTNATEKPRAKALFTEKPKASLNPLEQNALRYSQNGDLTWLFQSILTHKLSSPCKT